ncbi:MAG: hypothetical protein DRG50_02635 [Deltaproteobacteria bacterium]|nr:MAG: hypothetical protein DRG50_02635 [Deltaproteobacteria bacterium]
MDGVVSAAICSYVFQIKDVQFAGPSNIIKAEISISEKDIVCDLPYPLLCGLWFDHHEGNLQDLTYRNISLEEIKGSFALRDSCSRVVYEYFSKRGIYLPPYFEQTVQEADIIDSFNYRSIEEWRRETPGKLVDYSLKASSPTLREKHRYMRELVRWVRDLPLEEVVSLTKVRERIERYRGEEEKMLKLIQEDSSFLPYDQRGEIIIIDLTRHNRRPKIVKNLAYLLYPQALAVLEIHNLYDRGVKTTNLGLTMSLSINLNNRDHKKDLGEIMRELNIGDGHKGAAAGTVYADSKAEMLKKKEEMLRKIYELWLSQGHEASRA